MQKRMEAKLINHLDLCPEFVGLSNPLITLRAHLCYFSLPLLMACGGGGTSALTEASDFNPRETYKAVVVLPKVKTYTVSGSLSGKSFTGSGTWAANTITTILGGSSIYAQTISYAETSVVLDGVARTPSTDTATYFFSSDIKFVGAESGGRASSIEVVRHTDLPVSAKVGDAGEIVQYRSYSDATKKTQVSTTTERWSLAADSQSPTGVSFQIVRATVFTDPAQSRDPLIYTDRYALAANGSVEFTSRTVYLFNSGGTTNLSYSFGQQR